MKKERNWLDYAQLASSVGQNIQLGGIKGRLDGLQSIEAQKQRMEAQKQNEAQRLARFRKYLFELEDEYDALQNASAAQSPKEILWRILKMRGFLRYLGSIDSITYEDKDRHRALAKRTELVRAETEKNLKPDEIADLNKAIEYRSSLPELKEGIAYKQAVESHKNAVAAFQSEKEAAQSKLDELKNAVPVPVIKPKGDPVAMISFRIFWIGSIITAVFTLPYSMDAYGVNSLGFITILSAIAAILCTVAHFQESLKADSAHQDSLNKLRKELAEMDANQPTLKETEFYLYTPTEADEKVSAADLMKICDDRAAFIVRVSGSSEIFKFTDLEWDYVSWVTPQLVIQRSL